jgi:hypothetical protein
MKLSRSLLLRSSAAAVVALAGPWLSACLGQVTGSGVVGYVPVWTGTTSIGDSSVYYSSGSVGIGTASPGATLEVNGAVQVDSTLNLTANPVYITVLGGLFTYSDANGNFGTGPSALNVGYADYSMLSGTANTAAGAGALQSNTSGSGNTALGNMALETNTSGAYNTAVGDGALQSNTSANSNVAVGYKALYNNTGASNTAVGTRAMLANTSGDDNLALGADALRYNTSGGYNVAVGPSAMYYNATGTYNTAVGYEALYGAESASGSYNVALGNQAGYNVTTGGYNIAIGYQAGTAVTTNSGNIDIGNAGSSTDSYVTRIGTEGTQSSAFIAGIDSSTVSGVPVLVGTSGSSLGQLGVASSSRRYKEDIQDMGDSSSGLMRLRPVTFRYKKPLDDGTKPIQYGLVAEEVAEVYPDLVTRSADGQLQAVKYQALDPMLLNEVQKQQAVIASHAEQISAMQERLARIEAALRRPSSADPIR